MTTGGAVTRRPAGLLMRVRPTLSIENLSHPKEKRKVGWVCMLCKGTWRTFATALWIAFINRGGDIFAGPPVMWGDHYDISIEANSQTCSAAFFMLCALCAAMQARQSQKVHVKRPYIPAFDGGYAWGRWAMKVLKRMMCLIPRTVVGDEAMLGVSLCWERKHGRIVPTGTRRN